jgi:DNA-binding PadR family transcriptional regulator
LTLIEGAVLGLLVREPAHGFAVAKEFEPQTRIGSIFSAQRPVVYRALNTLSAKHLIATVEAAESSSSGPARVVRAATDEGRARAMAWILTPVDHMRGVRVELLVKLALQDYLGIDSLPFIRQQYDTLQPIYASLRVDPYTLPVGFERTRAIWRWENSEAVMRFLRQVLADSVTG